MDDTFKQSRKPINVNDIPANVAPPAPIPVEQPPQQPERSFENLPPALATALQNAKRKEEEPAPGPRLAYTGNDKLDQLLAGLKETIHKYEEVIFPSRGKFYDDNVAPSNGVIHVRCMTGEEEAILSTPRYIKKGQAINMIFKNCVRENLIPEKLLSIDRTWLLIYLRGISYSADYEVDVKCPACDNKFSHTVDLDTLMVNYCSDNMGPEMLTGVLPASKYKFTYRLATGKDETLISEYREKRMRQNDGGSDDTWTFRASLLVEDIEGLNEQQALQTLISRLPIDDVSYIRNLITEPLFGVDTKIPILCPMCIEEFEVDMPMEANFFFPRPRKAKPTPV